MGAAPQKRNFKKPLIVVFSILGAFLLLGALLIWHVITSITAPVMFAVPVPASWTMVSESGEIAKLCVGSYEECGSITRIYRSGKSAQASMDEFRNTATQEWWTYRFDEASRQKYGALQATVSSSDGIAYVHFTDTEIEVKYVKN